MRKRGSYHAYSLKEKTRALKRLIKNGGNASKTAKEMEIPLTTIITWKINYFKKQGKVDLEKWSQMLREIKSIEKKDREKIIQHRKAYYLKNKDLITDQLQKSHLERHSELSKKEEKVICYYLILDRKQTEIAKELKLTRERIRQLLNSAFIKLGLIFAEEQRKKEWISFLRNKPKETCNEKRKNNKKKVVVTLRVSTIQKNLMKYWSKKLGINKSVFLRAAFRKYRTWFNSLPEEKKKEYILKIHAFD